MKRIIIILIMFFLLSGIVLANSEEEVKVLKLPYGVSVVLAEDERLPVEWWHTFSLNVDQDLNTKLLRGSTGLSFGNDIIDFFIGYSRSFRIDSKYMEQDWGTVSFSMSWDF